MKNNKTKLAALVAMTLIASASFSATASGAEVPKRPSVCKNQTSDKIENYIDKQERTCELEYDIDTENKAEDSDYWSDNENTKCDLGFKFPSLPGFNLDFSALNACEIMQAVTEEVVDEVNDTTQGAIDNVTENVTGDKDGIDMDIDPNDTIIGELENEGVIE